MFETTDLALATVLMHLGYRLEKIDRAGHKKKFVFKKSDELQKSVNKFWQGELLVEPKKFFYEIKDLKARLYDSE